MRSSLAFWTLPLYSIAFALYTTAFVNACSDEPNPPGGTSSSGQAGASSGQGGSGGAMVICEPWSKRDCYTGPIATMDIGTCSHGFEICNPIGTDWSYCEGEVLPVPENCANTLDDDCDGVVNQGCP